MQQLALSFIIPALNEEMSLPFVLNSINMFVPESLSYEIIIADNGSTDNTVNIAVGQHAKVIIDEKATIGGLRNLGAKEANGRVLVFLDADIVLTKAWGEHISKVYQSLIYNPWQITGSRCGIPADAGWIERFWFLPLAERSVKYINSGHLITTADLFRYLGGFDERLESGEDYEFGRSASAADATITNNPLLVVVHNGYPKTLSQFIKREIWHGRGDCKSLHTIKSSNVAIAAIIFMALHLVAIAGIFYNLMIGGFILLLIVATCVLIAIIRHNAKTMKSVLVVSTLYYFYFISRFLSCIPSIAAT